MTAEEIKKGPIYLNMDDVGVDVALMYELQSGETKGKFMPMIMRGTPLNMSPPEGTSAKDFLVAVHEVLDDLISGDKNSLTVNPGLDKIKRIIPIEWDPKAAKRRVKANPYYLIIGNEK